MTGPAVFVFPLRASLRACSANSQTSGGYFGKRRSPRNGYYERSRFWVKSEEPMGPPKSERQPNQIIRPRRFVARQPGRSVVCQRRCRAYDSRSPRHITSRWLGQVPEAMGQNMLSHGLRPGRAGWKGSVQSWNFTTTSPSYSWSNRPSALPVSGSMTDRHAGMRNPRPPFRVVIPSATAPQAL